jgi:hypothetical protein
MGQGEVMEVEAYTRESIEYDRPPQKVRGTLTTHWVAPLNYLQHLVNGVPVNADTIRPIDNEIPEAVDNANPEGCNQYTGPGCSVGERPSQLSNRHTKALSALSRGIDVSSPADLKHLGVSKAVLSDLLKGGYVTRSIDYEGEREVNRYRLTEKGAEAIRSAPTVPASKGDKSEQQRIPSVKSTPALRSPTTVDIIHKVDQGGGINAVEQHLSERATLIGPVQLHGMSTPEQHVGVTIDGVRFSWQKDNPSALTQVASSLAQIADRPIPSALWKANEEVVFTFQRNKEDAHWQKTYGLTGFESGATGSAGSVVVYNGRPIPQSLFAHESGHNLASKEWWGTEPHHGSEYGLAQLSESPVTPYGAHSRGEDFAEAASLYVTSRDSLREKFPLKFRALEHILNKHG